MINTEAGKDLVQGMMKVVLKGIAYGVATIIVCFSWLVLVATMANWFGPIGLIYAIGIVVFLTSVGIGIAEWKEKSREAKAS